MKSARCLFILILFSFYFSNNAIGQWEIRYNNPSSSTEFDTFERVSEDTILFSGPFAATAISYSGGDSTWYTVPTSPGFHEMSFAKNSKIGYAAGAVDVGLYKSIDGGKTWFSIPRPNMTSMSQVYTLNEDKVIFAGPGILWRSDNGGASFYEVTDINPLPSTLIKGLEFPSEHVGYMLGSDGTLWKSTNGGSSWNKISDVPGFISDLIFLNENIGFVAAGHGILRTKDGGINWELFPIPEGYQIITSVHFYDENYGIAAGFDGLIMLTNDGGDNWHFSENDLKVDLLTALMVSPTFGLVAGEQFTLLENKNLQYITANKKSLEQEDFYLSPNPFNSVININYKSGQEKLSVKIFNSFGQLVYLDQEFYSGKILLDHLMNGVYNCMIEKDNIVVGTRKIVKN